jgi:hypothetical protein
VANHLNIETNCYAISQKTIEAKLGFTKATIGKALEELIAWGIFTRERAHYEKAYTYRLATKCPVDCARLADHNTESELARLPKKQATPLPKKQESPTPKQQATGGLENSQLIERNKQINKEMNRARSSCSKCFGVFEVLDNGNREIIHTHDCAQLKLIMNSQSWNITQGQIGSAWDSLDSREQQIANYLSLAKGIERKTKKAEEELEAEKNQENRFGKIIMHLEFDNQTRFDPLMREWLEIVYRKRDGDLPSQFREQAVIYQKKGWHLKPDGDWREGKWIHAESFIESEGTNAELADSQS